MAYLSPEDYERIGHLEGDIENARADIAAYTAAHPIPDHPGASASASAEAIAGWETAKTEFDSALAEKHAYLQRLQQELKSIG